MDIEDVNVCGRQILQAGHDTDMCRFYMVVHKYHLFIDSGLCAHEVYSVVVVRSAPHTHVHNDACLGRNDKLVPGSVTPKTTNFWYSKCISVYNRLTSGKLHDLRVERK